MSDTSILLECNDSIFSGWETVTFSHSLDDLSRSFYLEINDESGGFDSDITEESECVLSAVDKEGSLPIDRYLSDRIELFSGIGFDTDTSVEPTGYGFSASGNGKLIDLVECSAIIKSSSWIKAKVSKIISDVCRPFGTKIDFSGLLNDRTIETFSFNQGDTAFSIIERLCRFSGVIPFEESDGTLSFITAGDFTKKAEVPLEVGKNIIRVGRSSSIRDRRSEILGKSVTSGKGKRWDKKTLQIAATATDSGVTRYRPMVMVAESKEDKAALQKRVNWEAQIRAGRSREYTVEVADIFQRNAGKPVGLWEVGMLVDLIVEKWNLSEKLLISGLDFNMSNSGRRTTLTLRNPNTYQPDPGADVDI